MTRAAWIVVAVVFALRTVSTFVVPLTGDEAYYWEWSKHLAFGYVDHPPAVAWTIWLFGHFGNNPGLVRLGFVGCGAVATLALAACATTLAGGDRRAGAVAALAFSLAPLTTLAFGSATPDGPYLACWSLSLWLAARAVRFRRPLEFALLGVALGGALLSRLFAFALPLGILAYAGVARRRETRRGFALALAIAVLVYAPFLAWNASHDWATFTFSLVHRHAGERGGLTQVAAFYLEQAVAFSPGIWLAALACALRPPKALLAWTGLPLLIFLTLFALFAKVEVYWVFGPFASLCAMAGVAYVKLSSRARTIWSAITLVPAVPLLALLFAAAIAPGVSYALVQRATNLHLRNGGPFEIFTFAPLARAVARLARDRDAVVMTDGYGFSSVLDFDAGIIPVVIGYDWQGREARRWYPSTLQPERALFVDKEPLATRPDMAKQLALACRHVSDGGTRAFAFAGTPSRTYYLTWCDGFVPGGIAVLRWER